MKKRFVLHILAACMLLPVLAKLMIPGRKKDLVASH